MLANCSSRRSNSFAILSIQLARSSADNADHDGNASRAAAIAAHCHFNKQYINFMPCDGINVFSYHY
jgi:hypothetical protein